MSPSKIRIGCVYKNKGAGRTQRKVLDIGPRIYGRLDGSDGVRYRQVYDNGRPDGPEYVLSLKSFASWVGTQVS